MLWSCLPAVSVTRCKSQAFPSSFSWIKKEKNHYEFEMTGENIQLSNIPGSSALDLWQKTLQVGKKWQEQTRTVSEKQSLVCAWSSRDYFHLHLVCFLIFCLFYLTFFESPSKIEKSPSKIEKNISFNCKLSCSWSCLVGVERTSHWLGLPSEH